MSDRLLEIDDLTIVFPGGRGALPWQKLPDVRAVQNVSFWIDEGETLGLVGESGSGKTTVGRAVLRFLKPADGSIRLGDFAVTDFGRAVPKPYRKAVQVVFQDPVGSLNPSMLVGDIIGEPLSIHFGMKGDARRARAGELLEQVGLQSHHLDRYPYEFSGGQRQRIAIARALATEPDLLVLDEPVSALDVSTQSQVINLLEKLQRETGAAYLFIAHDLAVVRHVCQRIAVMYHSRIVETGASDDVCENPTHPYTELLLASIPDPDPVVQHVKSERRRALTRGIAGASGRAPTDSCPFAERCPHVMDICHTTFPEPVPTTMGGEVACHLHTSGPMLAGRPLSELTVTSEA
ncbi:MAG: ATP-binding cassette domain-containing protein [Actinomycetota bacterium]|nr:ATP-binding cassette domain-containing protein [Actinomycetota bacterium]